MNALAILQHAYQSIAMTHPDKDAFEIVKDVEDIAKRLAQAVRDLETTLGPVAAPSAS